MPLRIRSDQERFRKIVRGKIRDNLQKYLHREDLQGKQGKDIVRIPIPQIDLPQFKFGKNRGGVGQGEGEEGDLFQPGENPGGLPGNLQKEYERAVNVPLEEITKALWEEIELPFREPIGKDSLQSVKRRYTGVSDRGVVKHKKKTFNEALRRTITEGSYDHEDPRIIIQKPKYRSPRNYPKKEYDAAIILVRDISTSIDEKRRKLITATNQWLEQIIRIIHPNIDIRYIIHAVSAEETDRDTFNTATEGGGTFISSGFEKCLEIIESYSGSTNIYPFYYSDGDNRPDDYVKSFKLLDGILQSSNMFCYGQCDTKYTDRRVYKGLLHFMRERYGAGPEDLNIKDNPRIRVAEFKRKADLIPMLKVFLNKNKVPFYKIDG